MKKAKRRKIFLQKNRKLIMQIVCDLITGVFFHVDAREKLSIILQAEEHILGLDDGKERFIREVTLLSQAFRFVNST
jgi:hypothetical protein